MMVKMRYPFGNGLVGVVKSIMGCSRMVVWAGGGSVKGCKLLNGNQLICVMELLRT